MVARSYVPDAGDLVWLTFDPQAGHEQRGRRPALILSPRAHNAKARLAIACPITSHAKGYPFEVALPDHGKVTGVVLADHVKNLDWNARRMELAGTAPVEVLTDVRNDSERSWDCDDEVAVDRETLLHLRDYDEAFCLSQGPSRSA